MSGRCESAESVVLPVPERPKKIATSPSRADVGRAVHRQRFAQRQQIVHHREDRLLDLAGVARAADQDDALGEVHQDERRRVRVPSRSGSALKQRRVDDRELGREIFGIGSSGAMKRSRAKRLCHANSVTTRIGRR